MSNGQPGGAPQIMIDGVPLQKPEPAGLRLLKHVAADVARGVAERLPPGVGFALVLVDGGHEGFWCARVSAEGPNPVPATANWLASQGVVIGSARPAVEENPAPTPPDTASA